MSSDDFSRTLEDRVSRLRERAAVSEERISAQDRALDRVMTDMITVKDLRSVDSELRRSLQTDLAEELAPLRQTLSVLSKDISALTTTVGGIKIGQERERKAAADRKGNLGNMLMKIAVSALTALIVYGGVQLMGGQQQEAYEIAADEF